MKKKIKVLCGYANTGGIAYKIAEGLRKSGVKADAVVIDEHTFSYGYHKKLKFADPKFSFVNRLIKYYYFIKHTLKYDIFIFNTRSTMLSRKGDLKFLKLLGKKTAMIYVGCDIRDKEYYLNSNEKYTVCKNCSDEYQKKIRCIMTEKINETKIIQKNASHTFSHPFDANILGNKYSYLYLLLELDKYIPKYDVNNKVKIVHIPSDDGIKGTKYILEAVEKLKGENISFDFKLIRNIPHNKVIEEIQNADILIDQMVAGWYGLISVESMALGKTTVCYLRKDLYNYIPDIPIINLNPDNLAQGLKELIHNKQKLIEYGNAGRKFVEKYHDYVKNANYILNLTLGKD
ncbi:MAG: glycosyltransferase [Ignavibacteria bacterium]|nr:glycosyltransferase [Ignavibacteria bacterium]